MVIHYNSDLYYNCNAELVFSRILEIAVRDFTFPLDVLGNVGITCKFMYEIIYWRVSRSLRIRNKLLKNTEFAFAVYQKFLKSPITYNGNVTKIIPLDKLHIDYCGVQILPRMEDSPNRFALCNVQLLARDRVPFTAALFVHHTMVAAVRATPATHVDTGENTHNDGVGRYLVDLQLPLRYNPLLFGDPVLDPRSVKLNITDSDICLRFGVADDDFIREFFSHVILNFKVVCHNKYTWSDYTLDPRGKVRKESLLKYIHKVHS